MNPKIVIAGGSGLVGKEVADLLARNGVEVHLVSRRPTAQSTRNVQEHVALSDEWPAIVARIKPDVAISCLGTTIRTAGSQDAFKAIDHALVLAFAQASHAAGTQHFITVSSVGAMPASSNFYLRTKAEMEQGLCNIGFQRLDIMRPSLLTGGKREGNRPGEALGILLSPFVDRLMVGPMRKYASTPSHILAQAIAGLADRREHGVFIHENDSIRALAG
ncbi:NAD-dependent epimerase/dehydratase family protein [Sphingorhabdus sp. EL138]|uniref:NAD-dependent epimerase/dehydratase family protein n=1 Tax=Sphingorhabdus sp. EL138 TaxID=2073156 RepID=UPI0025D6F124|nr:NAD-dependent epimerase/dehydratase family protein [Sphingorhabdus sp. EL138]